VREAASEIGVAERLEIHADARRRAERRQAILWIAGVMSNVLGDQGFQGRTNLFRQGTTLVQDLGQWPRLVSRLGAERSNQGFLVDEPVLKGDHAEEEILVAPRS
jgi:hypothetical protein